MTDREHRVSAYVSEETKAALEDKATEEGVSVSTYLQGLIERHLKADAVDELSQEARAEERLLELIALGKDELRQSAGELRELNAKLGAYAIANFEMMKYEFDHADTVRRDALSTGARRIRKDLDVDVEAEVDIDERDGSEDSPAGEVDGETDDIDDGGPRIDLTELRGERDE
jgi:hypothetical protein